jgi:hypothetical protein
MVAYKGVAGRAKIHSSRRPDSVFYAGYQGVLIASNGANRKRQNQSGAKMSLQTNPEKATPTGSPRSQHSMLAEKELRAALQMAQAAVASTEVKVSELEGVIERLTRRVATFGDFKFQQGLDLAIAQLATVRARIEPYKSEAACLEAEIQALQPSQVEIAGRRERQREFASLASERLEWDREAERLIEELRTVLRTRCELTMVMATSAKLFDLAVLDDALDASRVEKLLDSLPESIVPQSERWYGLFFGNSKTETTYVVISDSLVLPETFSSNGLLSFGDRVQLTEEDAREFLRKDRLAPGARFSSDLLPPDIMSEEDFGLAVEAAKAKGHDVDWEVHSMHRDYCEKISKEWSRQKHIDLWGEDNKTHPFLG